MSRQLNSQPLVARQFLRGVKRVAAALVAGGALLHGQRQLVEIFGQHIGRAEQYGHRLREVAADCRLIGHVFRQAAKAIGKARLQRRTHVG